MGMVTVMVMDMDMAMTIKANVRNPIATAILFCLNSLVIAQQSTTNAANGTAFSATSANASTAPVFNEEDGAAPRRQWAIKPRISLTETFTDNVNVNRVNSGKQSDLITELTPGISIEARTARLKAYFDYSLRNQLYTRQSDYNQSQNALNTFGTLEAVDNWLFLDFNGLIAQQAISAFGAQSPSNSTINSNSTETATYRLSPYIRGQLLGVAEYLLRYNLSTTRSDSSVVSDINISEWVGQLRGSTPFQNLKWTIDGSQQATDYSRGRDTDADRLRGMLTYALLPQFKVSLSGGREANNYVSLNQESHNTHGYGFDWNPTERTQISAFKERRFFGDGHNISFSHRFPMSSIRFTDIREVSVLPNQFTSTGLGTGLGTIYDLLFEQFASQIPDPVTRASFVNTLLAGRLSPNTPVTSSFLASRATIQRSQNLAAALFGARNSVTLLANRTESQSAFVATDAPNTDATTVRQQGLSVNLSHRLSERSNLNALASRQESTGINASARSNLKTTMTTYQVNVITKLGAKTSGSLSARHSAFDSTTNPYKENALIGTVSFIY